MKKANRVRKWVSDISTILVADKLPYLFTILIAIIAYQLDHFIGNLSETPIIQYRFVTIDSKDSVGVSIDSVKVIIENLNKKTAFKNLIFEIKYSSNEVLRPNDIYGADLIAVSPSTILPDSNAYCWRSKFNHYEIPILQPGGIYWAMFKVRRNKSILEMPLIYLKSSDSVWLTDSNLQTFIIKYEIFINLVLIALSFMMMIAYANHINNHNKQNLKQIN